MDSFDIPFPEWLPDQEDKDNPGLIDVTNCLPVSKGYGECLVLEEEGATTLASPITSAFHFQYGGLVEYIIAGTEDGVFYDFADGTVNLSNDVAAPTSTVKRSFAQYNDKLIIAGGAATQICTVDAIEVGAASAISGAPTGQTTFRIGKFIFLGNISVVDGTYAVQWCAIDDPTDWPTPLTSDARNKQSGREYLDPNYGDVIGGSDGEFFGYIFQERAITKVTYIGGDVVFQFETISREIGAISEDAITELGGAHYFASDKGFFSLAGGQLSRIGFGKVDNYFDGDRNKTDRLLLEDQFSYASAASDPRNGLVYFAYADADTNTSLTNLLVYNTITRRWAPVEQTCECLFQGPDGVLAASSGRIAKFTGSPKIAIITTQEGEVSGYGRTLLSGIVPDIPGGDYVVARVGSRDDLRDPITWTDFNEPTKRTRTIDFRVDSRFHRVELRILSGFSVAKGIKVFAKNTGTH